MLDPIPFTYDFSAEGRSPESRRARWPTPALGLRWAIRFWATLPPSPQSSPQSTLVNALLAFFPRFVGVSSCAGAPQVV